MDKSDIFIYIFIGLVIYFSSNMFLKSDMVNLKCILSDVDGKTYCIRDRSKLKEAANLLSKVTNINLKTDVSNYIKILIHPR